MFHLHSDERLITTKPCLFTNGHKFNPSSTNNLELREFALSLSYNGNSLYLCASDAGRAPAVQIQENEVMQVVSLWDTVEPALAGSSHVFPDDALELQLFELEEKILRQAHSLAKKSQVHLRC